MADRREPLQRALDVAVYGPVGLVLTLYDGVPQRVRDGRDAIEQRIQLARLVGELAVRYAREQIQRELDDQRAGSESSGAAAAAPVVPAEPATNVPSPAAQAPAAPSVDAGTLPIGDYESLAAIHVVQRLGSLRADEIESVRQFEQAHRARRTILAKIAQLQDGSAP